MKVLQEATAPRVTMISTTRSTNGILATAIRLAADASATKSYASHPHHQRTLVKRSLIDELRSELDRLGHGDDWRTLNKLVRDDERSPQNGKS